jgi:DHA1 family bicyclomycin/chloramphenicol resistance-like MFS transporter
MRETNTNSALAGRGRKQKYLGDRGLIGLIAFLSAFVPLSSDLYLPALPGMAQYFRVSADQVNLKLLLHRPHIFTLTASA